MILFIGGIIFLIVAGIFYSKYVESQLGPDDRETPAVRKADGVDFVVMDEKKNWLVNLLNIAGTGPILGPIQGALFGPVALVAIPLGCVFAGAVHDLLAGFISMRNGGAQIPRLVGKYVGNGARKAFNVVVAVLLLLLVVVFVYTPGDIIASDILGKDPEGSLIWTIYIIIFIYYILSTVLPIDKLIGKIYPLFGLFLIISALGVGIGVIFKGGEHLKFYGGLFADHPLGQRFIPSFFITVACGILSGFHATQTTLISRTIKHEKEAVGTFYSTMIAEGVIAMIWAAGAMVIFNSGTAATDTPGTLMVGQISRFFMGNFGGLLAIIGVIVLPITSGDTAFRSLRLIIADELNLDQKDIGKRMTLTMILFVPIAILLWFSKSNPAGFNILWRYFGFMNQLVAVFVLAVGTSYLINTNKNYLIALIPGMFYTFITTSFISTTKGLGFGLDINISYIIAAILTIIYAVYIVKNAKKNKLRIDAIKLD
ncbi:MAG: carbon starvation CstA family protein [Anaerococcus sp.]|nr:carbon starvation CstA family protein [Anaerococcus sp.]